MSSGRVGVSVVGSSPKGTLALIEQAESLGVQTIWLPTGGVGPDALTLFAAAAVRTTTIKLGTSIVPTFPRHPLVTFQQAQVVADLAPGRLILGVGTSHQPVIEHTYGLSFDKPLEELREYITVLKATVAGGAVNFEGARFNVHAQVAKPWEVPVMISALRVNSFRLAGQLADGAIAWICPAPYLRSVALPALQAGAAKAGRATPQLVAHAFVAVSEDAEAVSRVARQNLGNYPRLPFYSGMLVAAGYPEAAKGEWSDAMIDAVVIHGNDEQVAAGLQSFLLTAGADQLIASILPVGPDARATVERTMKVVAGL